MEMKMLELQVIIFRTTLNASFDEIQYFFREEANRAYTKQRHDKQDRDEIEREKVRNNIREKYGIQKKIDSPREVRAVEVSVIVKIYLLWIIITFIVLYKP